MQEPDAYIMQAEKRAECGTLSRAADYVMHEYSDPVYITDCPDNLRKRRPGFFEQALQQYAFFISVMLSFGSFVSGDLSEKALWNSFGLT